MIKKTLKVAVFFVIGIAMFFALQAVLTPGQATKQYLSGFEQLEEDTVDVLFLGTSHVEHGISSMKMYEEAQVRAYSLATASQPVEGSYFLLKKALQTQSPQVVVLDVSSLFLDENREDANTWWRYIMDDLSLDEVKLEMAKAYADISQSDGFYSAVFPIIKYHSRWNELKQADFEMKTALHFSAGQYIYPLRGGTTTTVDAVDHEANNLSKKTDGYVTYVEDGGKVTEKCDESLYDPKVSEYNMEYVRKIRDLCEEHGAQLLLIKVPVRRLPQYYRSAWSRVKYDAVREAAEENEIVYFDFEYDAKSVVNFLTDTSDGGGHLNFYGAEKIASFLVEYLEENYGIRGEADPIYDEMLNMYRKVREVASLQWETDFIAYIERLRQHKGDWSVYIAASEDYMNGLREESYRLLEDLGLQLVRKGRFRDSYLAVIQQGNVEYEAVSDRKITFETTVDGKPVEIASAGINTAPGVSIVIDGTGYAVGGRGLNFVVYDHESEMVIDSVRFDTHLEALPYSKNWARIEAFLRNYEDMLCLA